ncbi:MAG: hypothetical protein RL169_1741 [Armatimonadota bacterium]
MHPMANEERRLSVWDVLTLLKQVPVSVYIFPLVAAAAAYVLLGTSVWLLVTPFWKELAGEWDVVGKFVAIIAWIITFPLVFNLLLSIVVGFTFDPLASAVDQLLHRNDHQVTPIGQQWIDGFLRVASLLILQLLAFLVGLAVPVLGLVISGAVSVITTIILVTTPAFVHRGVRFSTHVKVLMRKLGVREILFGTVAAILLNNPVLQVITLVPLIVIGQLWTRSWLVD